MFVSVPFYHLFSYNCIISYVRINVKRNLIVKNKQKYLFQIVQSYKKRFFDANVLTNKHERVILKPQSRTGSGKPKATSQRKTETLG
nr:MAG TPA: hypothetical protein [Caudoviricetes sp.]